MTVLSAVIRKNRHVLERLIERHDAEATGADIENLAAQARHVFRAWKTNKRSPFGAIIEARGGSDAVTIRLIWKGRPVPVVYVPRSHSLRTVLPNGGVS